MDGAHTWRPSVGGLWSDVGVGLIAYGAVVASPTVPVAVISGLAILAGFTSPPPLFVHMVVVGAVGLAMVAAGWTLLRLDQRDRRERLRELDNLSW